MLTDFSKAEHVYVACGYTDLRRGIDGLSAIVQQSFQLDPFANCVFLFCGRRTDRIKALYWTATVSCCCTSVLRAAAFSGQEPGRRSQS